MLRKSMDWFLYDNALRQERVKNAGKFFHFLHSLLDPMILRLMTKIHHLDSMTFRVNYSR